MKTYIITYPTPKKIKELVNINEDDFVIAVDKGLEEAVKQNIKIDLVIGDFDSLDDKNLLKNINYIKLDERKNETDTIYALLYAKKLGHKKIYILGGIKGERVDHFYANLSIFNYDENVLIIDDNTKIYKISKKIKKIKKGNKYISIFPFPNCVVSLTGFSYNLSNHQLGFMDPLGISNYVEDDYGIVNVIEGSAIIFEINK